MTKVCVELSNFVIFSGVSTLGLLVWDRANNNGKILFHTKKFFAEIKQSFINGDEQAVTAEALHVAKKNASEAIDSSEKSGSYVIPDASSGDVKALKTANGKNPVLQDTTQKNVDAQNGSTDIENEKKKSDSPKAEEKESK